MPLPLKRLHRVWVAAHTLPQRLLPTYPGLPACLPTCSILDSNNITGSVPASWLELANLDKIVVVPGNPTFCAQLPVGATFKLCNASDPYCLSPVTNTNASNCGSAPTPSPSGGSSFPVVAVAVPVAVVGVAVLAGVAFIVWRRRQQRASAAAAAAKASLSKYSYQVMVGLQTGMESLFAAMPPQQSAADHSLDAGSHVGTVWNAHKRCLRQPSSIAGWC